MFNGLCNSVSQEKGQKFNNIKVSSCHWHLENHKMVKIDEKGIVAIQIPERKVVTTIEDADLIQPLIRLRIKSICLMAFNQSRLSAFISVQPCNS